MTQYEEPEWGPLLEAVGRYATSDFMWMHEVELTDGTRLHAYKHIDTRRYVHLASDGTAFACTPSGRYKPIPVVDAFLGVFATLWGMGYLTEDQIAVTRAAIDRLTQEDV